MANLHKESDIPLGIQIPYSRGDKDGYFAQVRTTMMKYKTNLMMLLMTAKGERPMMPTYGSSIREILFEPNTADAIDGIIEDSIMDATEKWMTDIEISEIVIRHGSNDIITELDSMGNEVQRIVGNDTNEYTVNINITFSINEIPESSQELELNIGV
jgi:phage baseplate assembly protein W